jgi:CubicO group peptidase (beta-lactamase class C family)
MRERKVKSLAIFRCLFKICKMKKLNTWVIIYSLILIFSACSKPDTRTSSLPHSTPEAEGVSSEQILQFIEAAENSKNEVHSFMFLRHGKVIAEGWWDPYQADLKHTMYSTSKSFTSTAVGFAVSEKLLSVDDKVISFFPDQLPGSVNPHLADLRVKDLLSMSVGQEPDPTFTVVTRDTNWVKSFFELPIVKKPGTEFLYNTLATYMVSAILQKVTGQKVIDYLTPRLFDPLDMEGIDWEIDPMGINVGGWGLRVKTEDMAKLGQLYLQKGKWNGKQILPEEWIVEATTATIKDSAPYLEENKKGSSDWAQGYGYQFWRCRHNAFRADGAYGQYIIMMPDQDAVIVLTSETPDMQDEINLVWQYLLPAMQPDVLPANDAALAKLNDKLNALALPLATKSTSPWVEKISGKTFSLATNDKKYDSISFQFTDEQCQVTIKANQKTYPLSFGSGKWQLGETTRLGPTLIPAKAHFVGLPNPKVAGSYYWNNEKSLELILRYIESPHTERMICRFDKDKITIDIQSSTAPESKSQPLSGKMK